MSDKNLTTAELPARWSIHQGTLKNWRSSGIGPRYIRLGKKNGIRYPIRCVEKFEDDNFVPEESLK